MIKTIEIRQEEEERKDMEEEVFVVNLFTAKKKGINHLNVPNAKEENIEELKDRPELYILMNMPNHLIMNMLKEDKSQLIEESF